jgi:hypothetical protein
VTFFICDELPKYLLQLLLAIARAALPDDLTAVGLNQLAGHEAGPLAQQKVDYCGDFFGLAKPFDREPALERPAGVLVFFRGSAGA